MSAFHETAATAIPGGSSIPFQNGNPSPGRSLALSDPTGNLSRLSPRELEVLRALATGAQMKEVARSQGRAYSTIKVHVWNAYQKILMADGLPASSMVQAFVGLGWLRPS